MKSRIAALAIIAAISMFAALPATSFISAEAQPSRIFTSLDGVWRGSGRIMLSGGNMESIRCRAYYNVKDNGSGLGFAIRCAAASNKIELRGRLRDSDGQLSGTWEERTFNATGNVTGTAAATRVNLSIDGSVSGSMRISYAGNSHSVSISTATQGLRGISIDLRR